MIDRGKRSNTLSEVKLVENISKNLFRLKEDNPSQRNCQNELSQPSLSHIEQECQESLIQGKIHIQQNICKAK